MTNQWIYSRSRVDRVGDFTCRVSGERCLHRRYVLSEDPSYMISTRCFEMGEFPYEFSSHMFEFRSGIDHLQEKITHHDDDGSSDDDGGGGEKVVGWDDRETNRLLEYVERYDDWKVIAEKMKRPKYECMVHFSLLEVCDYHYVGGGRRGGGGGNTIVGGGGIAGGGGGEDVQSIEYLKGIVGHSRNPIMSLIHIIAHAVHPCLSSEIAKTVLQKLPTDSSPVTTTTNSNPADDNKGLLSEKWTDQEWIWEVAVEGWRACLRKAERMGEVEEECVEGMVCFLVDSLRRRVELKGLVLEGMVRGGGGGGNAGSGGGTFTELLVQRMFDTRHDE
jgi:hypothetical protein